MTGASGVVLLVAPDAIPNAFGLRLNADAHLLCYFYGASELSLCFASLAVARSDDAVRRAAFGYFALVHLAQAGAAGLAVSRGATGAVLTNAAAHVAIGVLFLLGLREGQPGKDRYPQSRIA